MDDESARVAAAVPTDKSDEVDTEVTGDSEPDQLTPKEAGVVVSDSALTPRDGVLGRHQDISPEDDQHLEAQNLVEEICQSNQDLTQPADAENTPEEVEIVPDAEENSDSTSEGGKDISTQLVDAEIKQQVVESSEGKGERADSEIISAVKQAKRELLKTEDDTVCAKSESETESTSITELAASLAADVNAEKEDPQRAVETEEEKENGSRRNEATQSLDREILFDDSTTNIQAFDDGSVEARQKVQGWTNKKWVAASDKVLAFTASVLLVIPGRYFFSPDQYERRELTIYKNPDIILVMRLPKDVNEVRRLLSVQGGVELSEQELHSFLIVESVADPKTCKLRLSQITNTTSVPGKDSAQRNCFDIMTPTETLTLSASFLFADSFADIECVSEKSLTDTHRCEDAVISALTNAHPLGDTINRHGVNDQAWKHQVVLGTITSYVISGNDKILKQSLGNALETQKSRDGSESETIGSTIIDATDDCGKTALHYACGRRKSSTVQLLVSAGADCSMSDFGEMTPCHISAKGLDVNCLSIVLSASYPTRPNPNALDLHGRTPMYLAAVEGKGVDGSSNAVALDLCLSAIDAWGGQLVLDSPKGKRLLHPLHCVSAQWKWEEVSVILSHCNYHYPLASRDGSDLKGASLSAKFQYPIHAALVSLRRRITSAFKANGSVFNSEFILLEPALVKTLQTLLEHGFEPNERFEGIVGEGEEIKSLSCYFGFTPLQLLALAAIDARTACLEKQESGRDDVNARILINITKVIQGSAEILLKNGARTNLPPPPTTRLNRATPTGCYSYKNASSMQSDFRERLKLEHDEIITLLGGANRVKISRQVFALVGKLVKNSSPTTGTSSSLDSDAPGGSDINSCALCWSEFGIISNRKYRCRVSCRFVCNECSTKRLVEKGSEQRVTDGQFLLSSSEAGKAAAKTQANQEERMQKQRESVTQARKALGLKSAIGSSIDTEDKTKLSTKDRITNAISGLGQTKDAVLERGDKLESLADKADALNQASLDFANMAKELERSQNNWW